METQSLLHNKPTYGGIKRYFRRRSYHRIDGGDTMGRRKMKIIRLRGSPRRKWRLRKLRWVVMTPLKILSKIKNIYMNFMLKTMNPDNILREKHIPKVTKGLSTNDFEARIIYEISKALVASRELYPM